MSTMTETAEPHSEHHPVVARERHELLLVSGALGIIGGLAMTFGTLVMGLLSPDHDPVADTISDLARGDLHVVMDSIFYLNAAGLIALALGAAHAHLGKFWWSMGLIALTFTALVVVMLGLWDEFGETAEGEGLSVHTRLSMVLWPLFLVGPLAMAEGAGRVRSVYKWLFIGGALSWAVAAPAFFFSPDAIDGLVERVAGAFTLLWTVPLGWLLFHRGREARNR